MSEPKKIRSDPERVKRTDEAIRAREEWEEAKKARGEWEWRPPWPDPPTQYVVKGSGSASKPWPGGLPGLGKRR